MGLICEGECSLSYDVQVALFLTLTLQRVAVGLVSGGTTLGQDPAV